ncbi:hypothetical protein C1646_670103 [Rhizophagus diaphanus]|nr:hypothetical protein C1646_670103 [Rhizophagus diaphanus] [Rhizophagus sp. MUCL 43196]
MDEINGMPTGFEIVQTEGAIGECVEIATSEKFSTKSHVGDSLIILNENNFKICNHEDKSDQFPNHRIRGGNIRLEEMFRDEYRLHRGRLKNRGVLFLEQLIEPYTNRMMKWSHFLVKNNLCKGPEPLWYNKLSEMVIDVEEDDRVKTHCVISRNLDEGKTILRKELLPSTRKESNKETIMWEKGEENILV